MIAVRRRLVFLGSDDLGTIPAPQAAQRTPRGPATFQSCVFARRFAGLSGAVHGYEPASPYHRVNVGSSVEPATRRKHAV